MFDLYQSSLIKVKIVELRNHNFDDRLVIINLIHQIFYVGGHHEHFVCPIHLL